VGLPADIVFLVYRELRKMNELLEKILLRTAENTGETGLSAEGEPGAEKWSVLGEAVPP
jgi:hypothetical protein